MWQLLVMVIARPLLVPLHLLCTTRVPCILVPWVAGNTTGTFVPHPCHQVLPCLPRHVLATIGQGLGLQLHCEAGVGAVLGVGNDGGSGLGRGWGGGGYNGAASSKHLGSGYHLYCTFGGSD